MNRPEGLLGFTRTTAAKPTIAAVAGYCVADGLEMALWCDLCVAGADAVFGLLERRCGVPPIDGGTQRLPRLIGLFRALDLVLTGRPVDATEALSIGLVDRVAPKGEHLTVAVAVGELIASYPQETLRSDRRAMLEGLGRSLPEGLDIEERCGLQVLDVAARGAARIAAEGRGGVQPGPERP